VPYRSSQRQPQKGRSCEHTNLNKQCSPYSSVERSEGFQGPGLSVRLTLRSQSTVYASASAFYGCNRTQASRSRSKHTASDPLLLTSLHRPLRFRWRAISLRDDQRLSMPSWSKGRGLKGCARQRFRVHQGLWQIYKSSQITVRRRTSFMYFVTLVLRSFREEEILSNEMT